MGILESKGLHSIVVTLRKGYVLNVTLGDEARSKRREIIEMVKNKTETLKSIEVQKNLQSLFGSLTDSENPKSLKSLFPPCL